MLYYYSSKYKDYIISSIQTNPIYLSENKVKLETNDLKFKKISEDSDNKLKSINYKS